MGRISRFILKCIAVLFVLVICVLIALPSIMSMGSVRNYFVDRANNNIQGKLTVADLNVGWFSGIDLKGVQLLDSEGRLVLQTKNVALQESFLTLFFSQFTSLG